MTRTDPPDDATRCFLASILANPHVSALIDRLPALELADAWLVAGCLYQSAWNSRSGRPPAENLRDYDIFYFDDDRSYEAEDRHIARARRLFQDVPVHVDLKNQARVHLWYGERFGPGYPPLRSSRDGVDRFLIACTRVAVRRGSGGALELYAPDSLDDLLAGFLRPNPINRRPELFTAKAASLRARWPWLVVVDNEQ